LHSRMFFWLEKPNFHNRRIYSAAWIVVRNLPGRQYFSIASADIHLCSYWRDLTSFETCWIWIVKSTPIRSSLAIA
jgi:hypothetical protein